MDIDFSTLSNDQLVSVGAAFFGETEARLKAHGDKSGLKTMQKSHSLAAKVSEKHKASGALLRSGAEGKEA